MSDARAEAPRLPLGNMRFRVEIAGIAGSGALEVVFPEARLATKTRPGAARYGPLIVKRGLTGSRDWYEWWDAARQARQAPKRSVRMAPESCPRSCSSRAACSTNPLGPQT